MIETQRPIAVIAGASGFIGRAVVDAFVTDGYDVRRIGRNAAVTWDDVDAIRRLVDGAQVVVNFAGASVNCRYTDRNRRRILDSRVRTTRVLREAGRTRGSRVPHRRRLRIRAHRPGGRARGLPRPTLNRVCRRISRG
jgi:uncharacterized protein YbjT (DUF2867 family)